MEDMEIRIDSQKQTLGVRDESIQRLLEMLQGQGQNQAPWGRGPRTGIITMAAQEAEAQLENMQVREVGEVRFTSGSSECNVSSYMVYLHIHR